ncbi:MAG: NADH-quinone oxidoreductase subunit M [Solirubrobacteraceae bacterium]|nr:NADH-quinone oxidoreductase subunit M [Solirubrobacteraceae bacterium]
MHLSIMLGLPAAFGLLAALVPNKLSPRVALLGTLLTLAYAITYVVDFDSGKAGLQYVTDDNWIKALGINYKLGVDGLNVFLLLLTAVLWFGATLWANLKEWPNAGTFFLWLGIGESAVLGALLAQDLALFVVFFDLMLVPFYFLTVGWGGPNRVPAVTKLVIYTLIGSLLMLTAAVATGVLAAEGTGHGVDFAFSAIQEAGLSEGSQKWIFLFFAAAFLVKMPAFPVHGWLPDGYSAMPLPALALFSGVLSKVAAYGFLRVSLPLFPDAAADFQTLMLIIALITIIYGSAMAFTQTNARLILGYSSIAQLGFITLGIFAIEGTGAQGAILQSVNHGLVTLPAMFILALLAARAGGSEDIRDMGGIAFKAPVLAVFFVITTFALLAMPGSSNFVGEFLILLGVFKTNMAIAILASAGVVLASIYALRLFIRAMHNRVGPDVDSRDLRVADGFVLVPVVLLIVAFGLYPQFALERSEKTTAAAVAPARAILGEIGPGYGVEEEAQAAETEAGAEGAAPVDPAAAPQTADIAWVLDGQEVPEGTPGAVPYDRNTGQPLQADPAAGAAGEPEVQVTP